MKSLEKDRARRYETANGLAHDVQRYLNDEAVTACPPSAAYRFQKFGRRNKVALLTSTMIVAALLAGTGISTWQAVRATRATIGQREAVRLAQANERTASENAKQAEAERARAESYFYKARLAIANIATGAMRGQAKWAELPPEWRKLVAANSLEFYESLLDENNPNPAARYETGVALQTVGLVYAQLREHDQAVSFARRSVNVLDAWVRSHPGPREYRKQRGYAHLCLGEWLWRSEPDEAQQHLRTAATVYEGLLAESPTIPRLSDLSELTDAYWLLIPFAKVGEADACHQRVATYARIIANPYFANSAATRPAAQAQREAWAIAGIVDYLLVAPVSSARENELALRMAATVVELDGGRAGLWETLGMAYYRAGDYPAAEAAIAKAIEVKHDLSGYREYIIAMIKWHQGDKEQARRHYDLGNTARRYFVSNPLQREAAELMGIVIDPTTRPVK
jgi:tetratricopeptide (TPR) repeat protein